MSALGHCVASRSIEDWSCSQSNRSWTCTPKGFVVAHKTLEERFQSARIQEATAHPTHLYMFPLNKLRPVVRLCIYNVDHQAMLSP
jgi:hypothetical protein